MSTAIQEAPAQILTRLEVAQRWRCDKKTVAAIEKAGILDAMKHHRFVRYTLAAVEEAERRLQAGQSAQAG